MAKKSTENNSGCLFGLVLVIGGGLWFWDKYGKGITDSWNSLSNAVSNTWHWITSHWVSIIVSVIAVILIKIVLGIVKKNKEAREQAEWKQEQEIERKRKRETEEREKLELKRKKILALKKRRTALIKHYGSEEIADRIMRKKVWQGQTLEQLKLSWGTPADKDIKVLKTKTKELWKYEEIGKNRYKKTIIIENGVVVGWEIK